MTPTTHPGDRDAAYHLDGGATYDWLCTSPEQPFSGAFLAEAADSLRTHIEDGLAYGLHLRTCPGWCEDFADRHERPLRVDGFQFTTDDLRLPVRFAEHQPVPDVTYAPTWPVASPVPSLILGMEARISTRSVFGHPSTFVLYDSTRDMLVGEIVGEIVRAATAADRVYVYETSDVSWRDYVAADHAPRPVPVEHFDADDPNPWWDSPFGDAARWTPEPESEPDPEPPWLASIGRAVHRPADWWQTDPTEETS